MAVPTSDILVSPQVQQWTATQQFAVPPEKTTADVRLRRRTKKPRRQNSGSCPPPQAMPTTGQNAWGDTLEQLDKGVPLHVLLRTLRQEAAELVRERRTREAAQRLEDERYGLTAGKSLTRVMAARGLLLNGGDASPSHSVRQTGTKKLGESHRRPKQVEELGSQVSSPSI